MQIIVNNLVTHYIREGQGEVVLFLHGWGSDGTTFSKLISDIAKSYECIALDLPGFGTTEPPTEAWNLDNYAAYIKDFLVKINVKKVAIIIGHSNGGAIAIRGLRQGMLQAKKLVLISSAGIRENNTPRKNALRIMTKVGKVSIFWLPANQKQTLRKKLYTSVGSDMLIVPGLEETFKRTVNQDIKNDASKLHCQTLLIYGDNDQATPVKHGQILASLIPEAQLEILSGNHFIHHDQAENVLELISDFIK
jgi:pimeloyl-ACP methyl ester carboxylesterase